jgi:general secretion pathway protein J
MSPCRASQRARPQAPGFTLIEVLVVLAVLALMALMAWRGLDAQLRRQQALQTRSEDLQTLQAALAQWHTDLALLHTSPALQAWHWDGRVLRLTRSSPAGTEAAVQVVAWSVMTPPATPGLHWMRWQSPPLRTQPEWRAAWDAAARWGARNGPAVPADTALGPGGDSSVPQARPLVLWPLAQWQLYVHRGGAWTNPLSSDAVSPGESTGDTGDTTAPAAGSGEAAQRVPDAVRLLLTLPPGQALAGQLQSDWVRPVFTSAGP